MRSGNKELHGLATEYFLRELTDDELSMLQEAIKSDPELGSYFIEAARDEWLMSDYQEYRRAKTIMFPVKKRRNRKIQRIAATIAVLLALCTIYVAQRTSIRQADMEHVIKYTPVASVQKISVQPAAVSAVNQGRVRAVKHGDPLFDGDRIVVPVEGSLAFKYNGESTTVVMGGGSLFAVSDHEGAKRIHITSGFLQADVDKQQPGKPMRISSHDAEIVVVGTSFEILVDQFTRLAVQSGLVKFVTRSDDQSIEIGAGMITDSHSLASEGREVLSRVLLPIQDENIGLDNHNLLHIDPKRNHQAFLKFDLGERSEQVDEARLRLRVSTQRKDGGGGTIRVFSIPAYATPENALEQPRKELAIYQGQSDVGEDLEFIIQPADLQSGINTMMIMLDDKWSNDIWLGSTETGESPELILKMNTTGE